MIGVVVLAGAVLFIYIYYEHSRRYWSRKNVPGPPSELITGNLRELWYSDRPRVLVLRDWTRKYGKVYGMHEGQRKVLVISDLEMLNEILVKQFDNFHARIKFPLQSPNEGPKTHLAEARGARWKRLRTLATFGFTNKSLMQISETVQESSLRLMMHLELKDNEEIDMLEYFQEFTMDIICKIALGQKDVQMFNNKYLKICKDIFLSYCISQNSLYHANFISPCASLAFLTMIALRLFVALLEFDEKHGLAMDFLELFGMWLVAFTMGFLLLPMAQVKEWQKRGTTDGFSSVHLILPVLTMGCWLRHGLLTADNMNIVINSIGVVLSAFYIGVFAAYTKDKSNLYTQLGALGAALLAILSYVGALSAEEAPDAMGKIAALAQNAGIAGGIYQIKTVIESKTTEFMPASMQFGILFLVAQWTLFGILSGNIYMAAANIPGLIIAFVSISLYVVYPPITWRVPIIGTQQATTKKNE